MVTRSVPCKFGGQSTFKYRSGSMFTILLPGTRVSTKQCTKIANTAMVRFLNMLRSPNFKGTLLVSIPTDFDHFQFNPKSFRKMLIFVHSVHDRNQGAVFQLHEALFISTQVPLHHGTDFDRIWVKLWPHKACYNPVTRVCKISDNSSVLIT